jgi:hypothetical protein
MIAKTKSLLRRIRNDYYPPEWPQPCHSPLENEPTFLFLFTPPHSGSTALAKMLNSASSSMVLTGKCEGQWLVPGLCKLDRWEPEKRIEWQSVKSVWMSKVRMVEELIGRVDLVIEKSPPNLVRSEQLLRHFPNHEIMVFNRNPYANCASALYRHHDPVDKSEDDRIEILKGLAAAWATRSDYAKTIIDLHDPIAFTYEEFCADVDSTMRTTMERIPLLKGINPDLQMKVKDYAPQRISDQNKRQISKLSERELETIAETFRKHEVLLNSFGYTSDWKKDVEQGGAGNAAPRRA